MKILNDSEITLFYPKVTHFLVNLALEFEDVKDKDLVESGDRLEWNIGDKIISATVFMPGDRFILKNFLVTVEKGIYEDSFLNRLYNLILRPKTPYFLKYTQKDCKDFVVNIFKESMGNSLIRFATKQVKLDKES